jgi:hypothetical protein
MFTKILFLTIVAFVVIRLIQRKLRAMSGNPEVHTPPKQAPFEVRATAWITVIVMVGSSLAMLLWE